MRHQSRLDGSAGWRDARLTRGPPLRRRSSATTRGCDGAGCRQGARAPRSAQDARTPAAIARTAASQRRRCRPSDCRRWLCTRPPCARGQRLTAPQRDPREAAHDLDLDRRVPAQRARLQLVGPEQLAVVELRAGDGARGAPHPVRVLPSRGACRRRAACRRCRAGSGRRRAPPRRPNAFCCRARTPSDLCSSPTRGCRRPISGRGASGPPPHTHLVKSTTDFASESVLTPAAPAARGSRRRPARRAAR